MDKNQTVVNEEEKLILRAALEVAEKNGFKGHLRFLPMFINPKGNKKEVDKALDKVANDTFYFHGRELVFNVGFINAFFPKNELDEERNIIKDSKYHTAEMYKTNPIRYIENYL